MNAKKENKDPTFIDQAFAIIEEHFTNLDPKDKQVMTISDHKLNCKVLDAHEGYIRGLIDERILRSIQSDELAESVAKKVRADVAETYTQLAAVLKNIEASQLTTARDISEIKNRLTATENKVTIEEKKIIVLEEKSKEKERRLRVLETNMSFVQPESIKQYADEIHEVKPILQKIVSAFKWWKIVIYCGIFLGLFLLIHYFWLTT